MEMNKKKLRLLQVSNINAEINRLYPDNLRANRRLVAALNAIKWGLIIAAKEIEKQKKP